VPANPWELRADVRPLEAAAQRWTEVGTLMARRGDELVEAGRRATEGWDAAAAESYEQHRRQVLANLDRFTTLATLISGSLRAVSAIVASSQKELDQAWTKVAMVPHETVGESRHLVFKPAEDDDRGKVTRGEAETEEIRRRLTVALDQESARMRSARAELVTVRTELMTLVGSRFPGFGAPGSLEESGVGTIPAASTSVAGAAQGGVSALAPIGPISVSMPDLEGVSSSALTPFAATAAAGLLGRRGAKGAAAGTPMMGGMGGGAMAARAGTMSRGMASGRSGPSRLQTPRLEKTSSEEAAARAAREKEAVKEAKRAALEEKRAERAARRAEREAERQAARDKDKRGTAKDESDEHDDLEPTGEEVDETGDESDAQAGGASGERAEAKQPAIRIVHEPTPGGQQGDPRR
jgi:hypothetical protein